MARRKSRKLLEADQFYAMVVWLISLSNAEWNEWEQRWLRDEANRHGTYIYSKTERKILNQLIAVARTFTHYSFYSVQELLRMAERYRADYPEHKEFLDEIKNSGATELRLRQIDRLATIVRKSETLTRDQEIVEVLCQTRQWDDSVIEVDEFTVYQNVA